MGAVGSRVVMKSTKKVENMAHPTPPSFMVVRDGVAWAGGRGKGVGVWGGGGKVSEFPGGGGGGWAVMAPGFL